MKLATPGVTALTVSLLIAEGSGAKRVEILRSSAGIPPHIVGIFYEPLAFQQIASGHYLVFDRRAHTVYGIDAAMTEARKIVQVGHEQGRIIQPSAFDAVANGRFVVADAPGGRERVQVFDLGGNPIGGFTLPGRAAARVTLGNLVLNGIGSLQFTGHSVFMSQPETGSLFTEYSLSGTPVRSFGLLRKTGQEHDRDVTLALNSGFPLINPRGGYYFVFQTGTPLFQKYDATGTLLFERHIEGSELDALVSGLPTEWPRRHDGTSGSEMPLVKPNVRAAAVDSGGNLWVAFSVPYTYVYDQDGEKTRIVQFRAAGVIQPTSLSFSPGGRLFVTPGCYEFSIDAPSPAKRSVLVAPAASGLTGVRDHLSSVP